MASCIIITSHLNDPRKEQAALDLLDFFKTKNLPIIFVGNYKIPESIQEKSDWVLYTKENPKINRMMHVWRQLPFDSKFRTNTVLYDHGYAHILQAYRGFKLAESLGYDNAIHINYDIEISNDSFQVILDKLKSNPNLVLEWGNNYKIDGYATHFYCFNIKDFVSMVDRNLHFYKSNNPPGIREGWYCEPFFSWMVERSDIEFNRIKLDIKGKIEKMESSIDNKACRFYEWEEKNLLLLWFEWDTPPPLEDLIFTHKDNTIKASPTPHPQYFTLPLSRGKYYDKKGNLVVDINEDHISQFRVIPM